MSGGAAEVIRAEGLAKRYPPHVDALAGVSLVVRRGEFVALLGPSGAGKTTLFRCLTGLTRPDAGSVSVDGHAVTSLQGRALRAARREVALIFQQFNLVRRLSALHNVLAGRLAVVPTWRVLVRRFSAADRRLALTCLETVGLADKADTRADQLSGGQQQRVGVARGLAVDPNILLMDEPFGAVDPIVRDELQNELLRLQRELGKTVLFVTHDVDEAIYLSDELHVMATRPGRVVETIPITLPRPRLRNSALSPEFIAIKERCLELLNVNRAASEPIDRAA